MPCQVQFEVTCHETQPGTHLRAVGSSAALGAWNPQAALPLSAGEHFPLWRSEPLELPGLRTSAGAPERIEYKYIICNEDGEAQRWEDTDNRVLDTERIKHDIFVCVSEKFNECYIRDEDRFQNVVFVHEKPDYEDSLEHKYSVDAQPLKEGAFGTVSRCHLHGGGPTCAVKIVTKSKLMPRDYRLLLGPQGEIEKHFRLKHAHIVPLYEVFHGRETVSLVMQYCKGGDLFDLVSARRDSHDVGLPETAAAVAMSHVLLALDYLHGLSIVHRDVKLENVLVLNESIPVERNVMKLCDFGFAAYDDAGGLKDLMGSTHAVAPEVVQGTGYGAKSDLWSAGVLLYIMLSAGLPFVGKGNKEVARKVCKAEYSLSGDPWPRISQSAKACVTSMLVVNPACRPGAADVLSQHPWLSLTLVRRVQGLAAGGD